MSEPIKIVCLITDEASTPRLDGTPGSAVASGKLSSPSCRRGIRIDPLKLQRYTH